MYAADPTPPSPQGGVPEEAAAARVDGCLQRGGPLAANMGSEAVAADLDILREAVGDERLNYYGVSYGTLIGRSMPIVSPLASATWSSTPPCRPMWSTTPP